MATRKFSEVLKEFLDERDRLNGSYYDNRPLLSRIESERLMRQLEDEMDKILETKRGSNESK